MARVLCSEKFFTATQPRRMAQISCGSTRSKWKIAENLTRDSNNTSRYFENYNGELSIKHVEKITKVKQLLEEEAKHPMKCLVIIDAIQRLGIDYHFQDEIQEELRRLSFSPGNGITQSQDLYEVSLYFRLLRQEGYQVQADVFNKFKDQEGNFKRTLTKDVRALRGMYEAAQLSIEGEHILDEAANFSSQYLNEWLINVDDTKVAAEIANTLRHPYHKSLAKFEANKFIATEFKGQNSWENTLQELSSLDSSIAQHIHRAELQQISKWWNDLGLAKELKLARDQPLKFYAWAMAIFPDLCLSDERIELTKSISLIYIIDDIFDVYGKPHELAIFTDAVNRWEFAAPEHLPDYMKMCYRVLYDTTNETCQKIHKKHGFNPSITLQKEWAKLFNSYIVEKQWFDSMELPEAEEYLKNGMVSSGVHVVGVHMFFLLGLGATQGNVIKLEDVSGIISSLAKILRLWDDLGSAKEDQEGHVGSYINCYLEEHKDVSVEYVHKHVFELISNEWKRLNKEFLFMNRISASFQKSFLNLARIVPLMYDYDDLECLPILEQYIKFVFYDNIC